MPVVVTRVFTSNDAGEPIRTFSNGDAVKFNLHFEVSGIPDNTSVAMFFMMRYFGFLGSIENSFIPFLHWRDTGTVLNNHWYIASTTWRVPDDNPWDVIDWDDVEDEPWLMQGGSGVWELTGAVSFTEPPREGEFDHNRERWLFQFRY